MFCETYFKSHFYYVQYFARKQKVKIIPFEFSRRDGPEQAAQLCLVSAFATQQLARNDRRSAQPAGSNIPLRPEHTVEESSWYNFYSLEKKTFSIFLFGI